MTNDISMTQKKILIVEDDPNISAMYRTKLEADGYLINISPNGYEGLEMAKKDRPDLVLLDVMMPLLDGFTVLEEIKKNKETKNIPVIMMTNLGTDEDIAKGKNLGASDYLVKANFTPAQVSEKVKEYLKN